MGVIRFQRVVREALPQDYSHYRPDTRINKSHIDDPSQVILNQPHPDEPSINQILPDEPILNKSHPDPPFNQTHPDEYDPPLIQTHPNDPVLTNGTTLGNKNVLKSIGIGGSVALLMIIFLSYLLYIGCRSMMSNVKTKTNLKKYRNRNQGSANTQESNLSFNGERDMTLKRSESIRLPVSPPIEFQTIRQQIKDVENSSFDDFPENIPPLPVQPPPIYLKPIPQRYTDPQKFQYEEELPKNCPDFYTTSKTLVMGDHRVRQNQLEDKVMRWRSTSGQNYGKAKLPTPPPPLIENNSTASSTSGHSRRPSGAVLGRSFSQIPRKRSSRKKDLQAPSTISWTRWMSRMRIRILLQFISK